MNDMFDELRRAAEQQGLRELADYLNDPRALASFGQRRRRRFSPLVLVLSALTLIVPSVFLGANAVSSLRSGTTSAKVYVGATPVHSPGGTGSSSYPLHTGIIATTFWVGEVFNATAADGSQVCSTYDAQWALHWSGKNNGAVAPAGTDCAGSILGGCDGVPAGTGTAFTCATQVRTAANGYFPTSSQVTPLENPFYLDLPFDDINDSTAYAQRGTVVPWRNDPGYAGNATNPNFSYMKNRWVKIIKGSRVCYGQNQDAGPGQYHDATYVFGTTNARPANTDFNNAGMDVSPALNGCLGFAELDGENDLIDWQWIEFADVPPGPWRNVVTTSGLTF